MSQQLRRLGFREAPFPLGDAIDHAFGSDCTHSLKQLLIRCRELADTKNDPRDPQFTLDLADVLDINQRVVSNSVSTFFMEAETGT